ncbi:hypothetical protein ACELLULO517_06740 [Acidisoma cellulosilytica]|uniref:Uncharacterized protein n=1 Tax=Acidisoma cellulosilyticum TaxID=2802395 RepID=A0A963YZI4_9PROT|nr:hypothetical protein [Acidisoma cellulosilyticum]MCB8879925.1 hypothetical protein [Acidisoma cellulosilyticum]
MDFLDHETAEQDDQPATRLDTTAISPAALPFTALVGQTVMAANELVSAWAMLYTAMSGHSLPFVGSLFDKWARESVQREHVSELAGQFLGKLPRELEQVETLLERAEELAHERDLLVSQPWSISQLHEMRQGQPVDSSGHLPVRREFLLEHIAQFEILFEALERLHSDVMALAAEFSQSRDVEKARVLNRSAVLAAELKSAQKGRRIKTGSRQKAWQPPVGI